MPERSIIYSEHALDRMLQWHITPSEVRAALSVGETLEEYDDGCRLVLGRSELRVLHVVAVDRPPDITVVVTTYPPSPLQWDSAFRARIYP